MSLPKSQSALRVGRGAPDGGPVVSLCSITWILHVALGVCVDTLGASMKSCREVHSYLGQLWICCKASDVNQLQAFTLALCLCAGLNSESSTHTQVTACASHLWFQSFAPCRGQNVANGKLSNGQSCPGPVSAWLCREHADELAPSARATVAPAVWRQVWLLVRWPGLES